MKRIFLVLLAMAMLSMFISCVGMPKFFEPVEPYCTPEEQKDSIIYKHLNPADTDFVLIIGTTVALKNHPEHASKFKIGLVQLKTAVEKGIAAGAFERLVQEKFGTIMGIVLGKTLDRFKSVNMPLSVCDKRLILGHIENQLEIVDAVIK